MADALHEFYNTDGLGFSALKAGVNIGGTTSSQKAVIRDIQITNAKSKSLTVKLGDVVIDTVSKTEDLSGTLILKESQNLTLSCNDEITWTGLRTHYFDDKSVRELTWDDPYFFLVPDGLTNTVSSDGWQHDTADTYFRTNENAFQNAADLGGSGYSAQIFGWDAEAMFGRDAGDYYFMRWFYSANANAGAQSNKIYYYDHSADSSTLVHAGSGTASRRNWEGGWTNRYFVCFPGNSATVYNYDAFDTVTNTLVKNNATFIRGYDSNTTGEAQIENFAYQQRQGSVMDKYCLMRHAGSENRIATLLDVTTGRYRTWNGSGDGQYFSTRIMNNGSSYANYHTTSQICKGTDGVYYVIWGFVNSSSNNRQGFQVWSLGTDPAATILAHGSDASDTYNMRELRYVYTNTSNWQEFRLQNDDRRYRRGYMSGFVPLKKITPTASACRYWAFLGQNESYVIDIQATANTGIYRIDFDQSTYNGYSDIFHGESMDHKYLAPNLWPVYDSTKAAAGWGTVGARTTGILNT